MHKWRWMYAGGRIIGRSPPSALGLRHSPMLTCLALKTSAGCISKSSALLRNGLYSNLNALCEILATWLVPC